MECFECSEQLTAIHMLETGEYTCVLCHEDRCVTTQQRGVKPLVQWLRDSQISPGFSAADKVVGKATAFLYCLLGAKAVYGKVMSYSAKAVLEEHNISAQYATLTEYIENRTKSGMCPFEEAVLEITDPEQALIAIYSKMNEWGIDLKE